MDGLGQAYGDMFKVLIPLAIIGFIAGICGIVWLGCQCWLHLRWV